MSSVFKMTRRTIRNHFGRFMALLLIVALSAGFFAGLKVTTDAMIETGNKYFADQNLYDFRLFSTLGFTEENAERFSELDFVETAEVSNSTDVLVWHDNAIHPFKLYALTEKVNLPSLTAGRLPTSENECLADTDRFTEDDIGKTFSLSDESGSSVTAHLNTTEFTIVGLADSPLHLGIDRGTTDIGNGAIYTFLYIPQSAFAGNVFTEINLTLKESADIYSDEYEELIDRYKDEITNLCNSIADSRYQNILTENGLTPELAVQTDIEEPVTYILTRSENAGYVSFKNDTGIISGVANIFPIFFMAIAILVCITTMTRMVDEERTQIGVLKAMGFSRGAIMGKYLLYAGSATIIGWTIGFFVCTWGLPKIFWLVYNEIYNFAPISYLFSAGLAIITLAISLISILGSTIISCRKELMSVPAALIRPHAGKAGKRVFLEHIKPIWQRLSFLQKITVRNIFRYKQRLIMMLVGISCCAGLVVTAFGVRDSMIDVGELQFGSIQKYDIEASFDTKDRETAINKLNELESVENYITVFSGYADITGDESMNSVNLLCFRNAGELSEFWDFHRGDESVSAPQSGEVIISPKIAEKLSLSAGNTMRIRKDGTEYETVTVSSVFDNHIYDYVVMSSDTYTNLFSEYSENTALITAGGNIDDLSKGITDIEEITNIIQLGSMEANISDALECLNYIIWLIIFCSGALAFIVIFNLTNINIAERSREIATVQVLGFYPKETDSYVLKENLILSVAASIIGLPLGKLFLTAVMNMVKIDMITFNNCVSPVSYILSFVTTVLFAVIVNQVMKRQINKINMAESLKAVE
ncbi:MAG: ABC transporter permease [Clostridia bacterium]|nr:ABC transporter permease [Clostridia bacterium]